LFFVRHRTSPAWFLRSARCMQMAGWVGLLIASACLSDLLSYRIYGAVIDWIISADGASALSDFIFIYAAVPLAIAFAAIVPMTWITSTFGPRENSSSITESQVNRYN
jgi:hypothetical protein